MQRRCADGPQGDGAMRGVVINSESRMPERSDPLKNLYCPVLNFCQSRVMARACSGVLSVWTNRRSREEVENPGVLDLLTRWHSCPRVGLMAPAHQEGRDCE